MKSPRQGDISASRGLFAQKMLAIARSNRATPNAVTIHLAMFLNRYNLGV
jgi:hypothetical protein